MKEVSNNLRNPKVIESGQIVCKCGCDITEQAKDVMLHNENVGSWKCESCHRTLYFALVRGDFNEDFCEFAYSFEPFPDVCSQSTDLPRCPNCGHEFGYDELYHKNGGELFKEILWDEADHDYDTIKEAVITCPHCQEAMVARMYPPDQPQPKYCTYQRVARPCQTCGQTHHFHVVKRTDKGVLLSDEEDTRHLQEEPYPNS